MTSPRQSESARRPARTVVLLLALAATAIADKVVLKDGRIYEGVVLEETEKSVRIKTSKALLTLPRDQIESIERTAPGPLQEREIRLGALDPGKPSGYLAVAKWLCGAGREGFDLPTVRRLCTIASKFDRTVAWEAQMLLAKEAEAAGLRQEAGACLMRAELARPGDKETKARLDSVRAALLKVAEVEMDQLQKVLNMLIMEQYEKALPKLRGVRKAAMSERAPEMLGMTMEQLAKDVARRLICPTCNGAGELPCPLCEGTKESNCTGCDGTGTRKDYAGGGREVNLADSACRTCWGLAKLLCPKCAATRDLIVFLATAPTQFTISLSGGSEKQELEKEVDLKRYLHNGIKVTMLVPNPPKSGGTLPCGDCEGVKFDPSAPPPPLEKLRAFRDEITACLNGSKTYDPLPAAEKVWDPAVIADELLRYRNGKWSR